MDRITRRSFLNRSASAAVTLGATTVAGRALSGVGANEKVRLAAIGVGGRCSSLIRGFLERGDCEFVTFCDVNPKRDRLLRSLEHVKKTQAAAARYDQDYRRVLDDRSIDAVVVATPDHWHGPMTIFACQAGKDVYVEKPPSHNVWEGRKMVEAARRYGRVVQAGTQNRSAPYLRRALELIRGGALGDIRICKVFNMKPGSAYRKGPNGTPPTGMDYDTWLGPASARPYNESVVYGGRGHGVKGWHHEWDFSGGDMADDGVHQLDIARWLTGQEFPKSVYATGGNLAFDDDREVPDTQIVNYDFNGMVMTFELSQFTPYMRKTNGATRGGDLFPHWTTNATRIELYGTKNLMLVGRHGGGWQILSQSGEVIDQQFGRIPDAPHKENFISCVKSRCRPNADIEEGHRSAALVHLANIAYRVGRKLEFDRESETCRGDSAANGLIKRDYRREFSVPSVV